MLQSNNLKRSQKQKMLLQEMKLLLLMLDKQVNQNNKKSKINPERG